jgi:hypothetical protein
MALLIMVGSNKFMPDVEFVYLVDVNNRIGLLFWIFVFYAFNFLKLSDIWTKVS